jgi:hypothetical protein
MVLKTQAIATVLLLGNTTKMQNRDISYIKYYIKSFRNFRETLIHHKPLFNCISQIMYNICISTTEPSLEGCSGSTYNPLQKFTLNIATIS